MLCDIYESLLCRQMTLWKVTGGAEVFAAAVTQAWCQPRVKVFDILAVGGSNMAAWEHLIADLEAYAQEHGFTNIRAHGRLGWRKQAERYGFEFLHCVYDKRLK